MTNLVVQASFNAGEWAPSLYARVDITKYKSAAALMENFFIDYRGGASTRAGSRYILQVYKGAYPARMIPFQASFNIGYALEFGQNYIRFYYQGSPILETGHAITGATRANPCVITAAGHGLSIGDWVYISGVNGMTQLNGRYFDVIGVAGANVTLARLDGTGLNSTGYGVWSSGGTIQRIYTLASPYAGADLAILKFAQIQNQMVLCHPDYPPNLLTLVSAANWTITSIVFQSTAQAPTGVTVSTTLPAGAVTYSYVVTSIDASGAESTPSAVATLASHVDIRTNNGTNQVSWSPAPGAVAYNVYESSVSYFGVLPAGTVRGYIGYSLGTEFIDSNIAANFTETPPVAYNPFTGSGVAYVTVAVSGTYTSVPTVSFSGGTPSIIGTAAAVLGVLATPTITAGGAGFVVGETINFGNNLVLTVTTVAAGVITAWSIANPGYITSGSVPANPIAQVSTSGAGTGATATASWGVIQVLVLTAGAGYLMAPSVIFSSGTVNATAFLGLTSTGNPSVPSFFQQRLVLAGPPGSPGTFYMSQPGSYFNYNVTNPVRSDNSITETLSSTVLESIKFIVSSTSGMLIGTDKAMWLVNGGSSGSAVTPTAIVATRQSATGANDVPPIVANYDVLYVSDKGSSVRDLAYNIYFNVFTGTDISITASHLFFGYELTEWAWAESPFYVVWAVRSDGVMLTLTFLKEQEFVGWAHQITNGLYKSVCAVTEATTYAGNVDAVYTIVQRTVNGNTVQYVERIADRVFPNGLSSAWCVDAGIQYSGPPANTFTGAEHLGGQTVTGLADGSIITPFVMPASGIFQLPDYPATHSTVTLGLAFTAKLQTMAIDTNKDPIQGKLKKIPHVDVRVNQTVGLSIGSSFNTLVAMKDLVDGNVSSMATGLGTQVTSGLISGDARTFLDPTYNVFGQFCLQQSNPYPATVLGVFPCLILGDTP